MKVIKYIRNGQWQGEYATMSEVPPEAGGPRPSFDWVTSQVPPQCFPDTFTLEGYEEYWKAFSYDIFANMPRECIRVVRVELRELED